MFELVNIISLVREGFKTCLNVDDTSVFWHPVSSHQDWIQEPLQSGVKQNFLHLYSKCG